MVRLKDIAKETGTTLATVSKALKHDPEISQATTELINTTAKAMGYTHRKPTRKATKTIGVVMPEVKSHYFSGMLQTLNEKIESNGYSMITILLSHYNENPIPAVRKLCRFDPDGLLVYTNNDLSHEDYQDLIDTEVPMLLLTDQDLPYPIDTICIKNDAGVFLAMEHLLSQGHRQIGYLGDYLSDIRYRAYLEFQKRYNLPAVPQFVKRGSERFEKGGYLRARELLQEKELPTAVLVSYDQIGYGAMSAFQEAGIRLPDDISIVGYDNSSLNDYYPVGLTSIANPVTQMCTTAVKILLGLIRDPKAHVVQNVALQSRLVIRNSTCPPKRKL